MANRGIGLTTAEISDQISRMHARRAEIQQELESVNDQLSKAITKNKNIELTAKRGGYTKEESRAQWIKAEQELRAKKVELQCQLGSMRDILAGLRAELRATAGIEARQIASKTRHSDAIAQLNEMRLYYERFAGDKSRVNSMRLMAGEFAAALAPIIRSLHAT